MNDVDLPGAWAQMEPEQREAVRQAAERRAALGLQEQEDAALAARREMIEQQADQAVEAVLDAARRGRKAAILPRLAEMAAYFRSGQAAGSEYARLASFLDEVAAVLRGEQPPEEAPEAEYAERLATVKKALGATDMSRG